MKQGNKPIKLYPIQGRYLDPVIDCNPAKNTQYYTATVTRRLYLNWQIKVHIHREYAA